MDNYYTSGTVLVKSTLTTNPSKSMQGSGTHKHNYEKNKLISSGPTLLLQHLPNHKGI